ncbi:hypothetical protein SAMN05443572_111213 [Myxococcus fulvus]|nr:hypothetical protein SAMN05443572_111213 [Myxococcus fulvus]
MTPSSDEKKPVPAPVPKKWTPEEKLRVLAAAQELKGRWRKSATAGDRRCGPHTWLANQLSEVDRRRILRVANREEFRDVLPKQIVPGFASTFAADYEGLCAARIVASALSAYLAG